MPKSSRLTMSAIVISVAMAITALPELANAQTQTPVQINIPAQALHQALLQLGQQTDIQIYYVPETVAKITAPAISGVLLPEEALQKLLAGTGITVSWSGKTASLQRHQSGEAQLGTVTVRGTVEGTTEGTYIASTSRSLKSGGTLIETPRAVSIVTNEQIKTQAPLSIERALVYTSGVVTETGGGNDVRMIGSIIRGFSDGSAYFKDGLKQFAVGSYGSWNDDMNTLDSIEVLKGPASLEYGQTRPGGVVNVISKRPLPGQTNSASIGYGTYNRKEVTADLNGALSQDDRLLYRLVVVGRKANQNVDFSKDNRMTVAPSLTWKISHQTNLTLLGQWSQERATPKTWWPSFFRYPQSKDIPVHMTAGDPNFNRFDRDTKSIGYAFDHTFDNGLLLTQNLRYSEIDINYQHLYASGYKSGTQIIERGSLMQQTNGKSFNVDNRLQKNLAWGNVKHNVSLGVDYLKYKQDDGTGFGYDAPDLDLGKPVYGQAINAPDLDKSKTDVEQTGFYLQDQIKWDKFIVNLGVRRDIVHETFSDSKEVKTNTTANTGNVGLLYHFDHGFAPYVSYSTSFEPVTGQAFDKTKFIPTKGKQYEIGVKYQPKGSQAFVTASLFDLTQQNVLTPDTNHPGFNVQTGEVNSKGLELEAKLALSKEWNVLAAYTYNNAVTAKSNVPARVGQTLQQVAKHSGSVWVDYRPRQLPGVMIGTGVRYKGRAPYSLTGVDYNASYTVVDGALAYETSQYRVSLNVVNLFDRNYYTGMFRGSEREMQVKATYYW